MYRSHHGPNSPRRKYRSVEYSIGWRICMCQCQCSGYRAGQCRAGPAKPTSYHGVHQSVFTGSPPMQRYPPTLGPPERPPHTPRFDPTLECFVLWEFQGRRNSPLSSLSMSEFSTHMKNVLPLCTPHVFVEPPTPSPLNCAAPRNLQPVRPFGIRRTTSRATPARRRCRRRRRARIILLNHRNSETCNKKEETPLHDHLEYLPVQNPLSEQHKDRT